MKTLYFYTGNIASDRGYRCVEYKGTPSAWLGMNPGFTRRPLANRLVRSLSSRQIDYEPAGLSRRNCIGTHSVRRSYNLRQTNQRSTDVTCRFINFIEDFLVKRCQLS
jgi:hypothetical protein